MSIEKSPESDPRPEGEKYGFREETPAQTGAEEVRKTPVFLLAERLLHTEGLTGRLEYHPEGDYFDWSFHEHLSLTVTTGEMGWGYIEVNGSFPMRPYAGEMYDVLLSIGKGETVFVTKLGLAGRYISGVYPLEYYHKKRRKLRFGVAVRIYSSKGEVE